MIKDIPSELPYITISVDKDTRKPKNTYRLFDGNNKRHSREIVKRQLTATVGEYVKIPDKNGMIVTDITKLPKQCCNREKGQSNSLCDTPINERIRA